MTKWLPISILISLFILAAPVKAQEFGEELPRNRCVLDLTVAYIGSIDHLGNLDETIKIAINTYKEISGSFDRICYGDILWLTRVVLGNIDLSSYSPTEIVGIYERILDELQ